MTPFSTTDMLVFLVCRPVSMLKGMDGPAADVEYVLKMDPHCGHLFMLRGKRSDYLKLFYWDRSGHCLFAKRLEKGHFVRPPIVNDRLQLSPAQLASLLEGIDWRRTVDPESPERPPAVNK